MPNNDYNYTYEYTAGGSNTGQQPVSERFPSLWESPGEFSSAAASCLAKVFVRMCMALAVTALAAYAVASSPSAIEFIFGNMFVFYALIIAELGLVIGVSWGINKLSAAAANALFFLYAAVNGLTLSVIFLVYDIGVIYQAFAVSAMMFGAMALYGTIAKTDLTRIGSICIMALMGIILASAVNIFFRSGTLDMIICYAGVLIFVGLTAYDTQRIKRMLESANAQSQDEAIRKISVIGALTLYLDFINLFLKILRILGRRR